MKSGCILIVDDEPDIGRFIRSVAEMSGYDTHVVTDSMEFEAVYTAVTPGFIILDLAMPGRDGIELIRFLGEQKSQAQVVLISGLDGRILEAARRLGKARGLNIVGIIPKPVRVAELRRFLGELLRAA